jgi:hypothetical protein
MLRLNGNYVLPFDILVGGTLQTQNGVQGQRTYVFRAADPPGGRTLVQQTTVTLGLEPFGAQKGPVQSYLDLRLGNDSDGSAARTDSLVGRTQRAE